MEKETVGNAILSVCLNDSQMTGILEIGSDTYALTPNKDNRKGVKTKLSQTRKIRSVQTHSIERIPTVMESPGICGNSFFPDLEPKERIVTPDDPKVNFGVAIVKVAVSIDQKMFKDRFFSDMVAAKQFVVIHMAYLQKQLNISNLKRHISMKLVITRMDVAPFYDTHSWDNYLYLTKYCKWSYKVENSSHVHILFSGSNLWWWDNNKLKTDIIGLTYTRRLCQETASCITVESVHGFQSLHTLVHEFGHKYYNSFQNKISNHLNGSLGAHHDGSASAGTGDCNPNRYIMSWSISNGKSYWSDCSLRQIRSYLLTLDRTPDNRLVCLQTEASPISPDLNIEKDTAINPGHYHTPDNQCRLVFGANYKLYTFSENICLSLKCKNQFFVFASAGALEGTECGPNRKCDRDICRRPPLFNRDALK